MKLVDVYADERAILFLLVESTPAGAMFVLTGSSEGEPLERSFIFHDFWSAFGRWLEATTRVLSLGDVEVISEVEA